LLPNGKVLIAGGNQGDYLSSAELYDPASSAWTPTDSLAGARMSHTATLLPDAKVLVAGGQGDLFKVISNAELYAVNLGSSNSWQPQIAMVASPLSLGSNIAIAGSQFRGISSASGGTTQDSSTDYPLVQLRSIESGQATFLLTTNWSPNSFTSLPVWNFPPGWAMATVFVNGIPSTSSIVNISVPVPTPFTITDARQLTNGSFQFAFTNSVGAVFGALAATNVSTPLSNWSALGGVTEISPGHFQFIDPHAANGPQRFYRIRAN
jgi:hypothetical protein